MKQLLNLVPFLLCSCAPFAIATFDPNTGNPTLAAQSAGTGHKAEGTAQEQHIVNPNTGFEYHSTITQSNPDGVELPARVIEGKTTRVLSNNWFGHENRKSDNATKEVLGAQGVQKNKDTLDAGTENLKITTESTE